MIELAHGCFGGGTFQGEPIPGNKLVYWITDRKAPVREAPVTIAEVVSTLETRSLVHAATPYLVKDHLGREHRGNLLCAVYGGSERIAGYAPYPEITKEKVPSGFIGREAADCLGTGSADNYFFRITEEKIIKAGTSRWRKSLVEKGRCLRIEEINKTIRGYPETDKLTNNVFTWTGTYEELIKEVLRDINKVSFKKYGNPAMIDI